jgi:hypothetical protein
MTEKDIEDVTNDIFDACINPIANMMCSLLVMQVRKGFLSRDEARAVVASSVDVLTGATITESARSMGADMLMRMLKAVENQT